MVPHSFSTITASSIRIGWVIANCTPAIRLLSTGRAARPATITGDAGRGEQAHATLPHRLEGHQRGADRHQRHQHFTGVQ